MMTTSSTIVLNPHPPPPPSQTYGLNQLIKWVGDIFVN